MAEKSEPDEGVQHPEPTPRPPPEPAHYKDIITRPRTVIAWLFGVLVAGAVQAAALGMIAIFVGLMLPMFIPHPLFMTSVSTSTYVGMFIAFGFGSAVSAHYYPHYSGYRSACAFALWFFTFSSFENPLGPPGVSTPESEYGNIILIPLSLLGIALSAFSAKTGSVWRRGFAEWLNEELDELKHSVGLSDEKDFEDEEEDEENAAAEPPQVEARENVSAEKK